MKIMWFITSFVAALLPIINGDSIDRLLNSDGIFEGFELPQSQLEGNLINSASANTRNADLQYFKEILENENNLQYAYENYLNQFNKKTGRGAAVSTYRRRQEIFKEKLVEIFTHNLEARDGLSTFEMGINEFSDMTWDEFSAGYLGYQEDNNNSSILNDEGIPSWLPIRSRAVAQDIDYRALGHVTSVKNQGGCGSCVPFAATACLESSHSLWHGRVHHDLSEQELVDCSKGNGNNGCQGGTFVPTFDYLRDRGQGLEREYPYEGRDGSCRSGGKVRYARVTGWWRVLPQKDENKLKEAVSNYGPIAVAVHVNNAFQSYRSGIFQASCNGGRNHAGLVVGYNGVQGTDYWIFKNSWGQGWGESGYIRIRRNFGNLCDIAGDAVLINA